MISSMRMILELRHTGPDILSGCALGCRIKTKKRHLLILKASARSFTSQSLLPSPSGLSCDRAFVPGSNIGLLVLGLAEDAW